MLENTIPRIRSRTWIRRQNSCNDEPGGARADEVSGRFGPLKTTPVVDDSIGNVPRSSSGSMSGGSSGDGVGNLSGSTSIGSNAGASAGSLCDSPEDISIVDSQNDTDLSPVQFPVTVDSEVIVDQSDCPVTASGCAEEVNLVSLEPAHLMFVNMIFPDKTCQGLIDTGATVSLIKQSLVAANSCSKKRTVIRGLGNHSAGSGASVKLPFKLGSISFVEEFVMVPDDSMKRDVILGVSFFVDNGLTLEFPRRISGEIAGGRFDYYVETGVEIYTDLVVSLSKDTVVKSTLDTVCGELLDGKEHFCFEGMFKFEVPEKYSSVISGESGLLEVKDGKINVLLETCSPKRKAYALKRGTKIGRLSTIVDLEVLCATDSTEMTDPAKKSNLGLIEGINLDTLNAEQQEEVRNVLLKCSNVVSKGDMDIGCAGVTKHQIELYESTPIRMKPRRFSEPVNREIERQCAELLKLDVIRHSKSPWSAPIVPIWKKDGTLRLCVDYRRLNKVTKADRYPMPHMSDLVFSLKGAKFFTTLDLVKGYYQIPLDSKSAEYTAFSTPQNHYEFKRLSFGLKNAPASFQREMKMILQELDSRKVVVYIDDILILGDTYEEHLDLVAKVLSTLEAYGMKIKPTKCSWFREEATFLGHVVSRNGIRKSEEYMKAVRDFPKPTSVKELRSFLGLVNFQRKFIENCSVMCKPLTRVMTLPDRSRLKWTQDMEDAFLGLKTAMQEDLRLTYPDYSPDASPLELSTDACKFGAGACLVQLQNGQQRVIAYASTTFNKAQMNYSVLEQELAAIRWGVSTFRNFLVGTSFVIYTDHRPLVYMANMAKVNSRIMRTLNELEEYNFKVVYKPGKLNTVADSLSRAHDTISDDIAPSAKERNLSQGLRVLRAVEGGGDSLVNSLWHALRHHKEQHNPDINLPTDSDALRTELAAELKRNSHDYGRDMVKVQRKSMKLWMLPGHLPPVEFIDVFCNLFQLEVWVHLNFSKPVIHVPKNARLESSPGKRVHIRCKEGVHYDPVVENLLYDPIPQESTRNEEINSDIEQEPIDECANECDLYSVSTADCGCAGFPGIARTIVSIGGKQYCALLDTGAQISLMNHDVWREASSLSLGKDQYDPATATIRTFGSGSITTLGSVHLEYSVAGFNCSSGKFALVESKDMPVCVILGSNMIQKMNLVMDFSSLRFSFNTSDGSRVGASFPSPTCLVANAEFCLLQEETYPVEIGLFPSLPFRVNKRQIRNLQRNDAELRRLFHVIRRGISRPKWKSSLLVGFKRSHHDIVINDGVLYAIIDNVPVFIISKAFMVEVSVILHWHASHPGRNKLHGIINHLFWHPNRNTIIRDICSTCKTCQFYKTTSQPTKPPINKIRTTGPFQLLSADLLQLPVTTKGHIGCLVTVDHFSKWSVVVPIKNKRSDTIAAAFRERILPVLPQIPRTILSDNGLEFVGEPFQAMLRDNGIEHLSSSPYHPAANGAVERLNRTLTQMLRCDLEGTNNWIEKLHTIVMNYNHSVHSELGVAPAECLRSSGHADEQDNTSDQPTTLVWKEGHKNFVSFQEGESVLKKTQLPGNLCTNKFKTRYDGPYKILRVLGSGVTYILEDLEENRTKAHHSQLKIFKYPPVYLRNHPAFENIVIPGVNGDVAILKDQSEYLTDDESCSGDLNQPLSFDNPVMISPVPSIVDKDLPDPYRPPTSKKHAMLSEDVAAQDKLKSTILLESFANILGSLEQILEVNSSELHLAQRDFERSLNEMNSALMSAGARHFSIPSPEYTPDSGEFEPSAVLEASDPTTSRSLETPNVGTLEPRQNHEDSPGIDLEMEYDSNQVLTSSAGISTHEVCTEESDPSTVTATTSRLENDHSDLTTIAALSDIGGPREDVGNQVRVRLSEVKGIILGLLDPPHASISAGEEFQETRGVYLNTRSKTRVDGVFRHTRSRGPAPNLPNVQARPIEFKSRAL